MKIYYKNCIYEILLKYFIFVIYELKLYFTRIYIYIYILILNIINLRMLTIRDNAPFLDLVVFTDC